MRGAIDLRELAPPSVGKGAADRVVTLRREAAAFLLDHGGFAGVPPTAGFFGKWYVFLAAVDSGLVWLAVAGVIASAISAFYYLRIVWFMWFDDPAPAFERDKGPALTIAAWGSALLMFPVLTVFMRPLIEIAGRAAASLF